MDNSLKIGQYILEVLDDNGEVVGFVNVGRAFDEEFDGYGEIFALYIINGYKKYMKDNEISDKDIETATSYVKPFVQFLLEKQEHIIDYPEDKKGKSKRNMTEEEKKAAQKKSEATKARNAKKQEESQDN